MNLLEELIVEHDYEDQDLEDLYEFCLQFKEEYEEEVLNESRLSSALYASGFVAANLGLGYVNYKLNQEISTKIGRFRTYRGTISPCKTATGADKTKCKIAQLKKGISALESSKPLCKQSSKHAGQHVRYERACIKEVNKAINYYNKKLFKLSR